MSTDFQNPRASARGAVNEFGMTLRDYFAAKAMQGLLAAQIHGFNDRPANGPFASMAYEMADAMLRARAQTKKGGAA